jgi:uncharacterized protein YndB with AHSA1/START domain
MEAPLIIERTYNASPSKVWKAITNTDDLKKWYFDIAEFKAEIGFEFQFEGGDEKNTYVHLCKVTEVIHERKLTYTWTYQGFKGTSYVTFELFEEGSKTRVKLTHQGLENFPNEPQFARKNFEAGWADIIGRLLKEFVEK